MSADGARRPVSHEEAARLLPWLVNGTLAAEERERMERHVRDCLACRSELREQQALRELLQRHPDAYTSAEAGFATLSQRLQARGPRRFARAPRRLLSWSRGAGALAVASAAAVALAVALWVGLRGPTEPGPAYRTLSAARQEEGLRLDLVFSAGATERDVRDVLAGIDGTIVGGPSAIGRYTIELGRRATDAEADELIQRLRKDGRVKFAGRSYIAVPGPETPPAEGSAARAPEARAPKTEGLRR